MRESMDRWEGETSKGPGTDPWGTTVLRGCIRRGRASTEAEKGNQQDKWKMEFSTIVTEARFCY